MKNLLFLTLFFYLGCYAPKKQVEQNITKDFYSLYLSSEHPSSTLILFGGFSEKVKDIKREFNIDTLAKENKCAVLYLNYSDKLWLEEEDKKRLTEKIDSIFSEHKLFESQTYLGGFSSGGNLALLLANHLKANKTKIKLSGVFAIDSPIDLEALYNSAKKNINRNFSEIAVNEGKWIVNKLESTLGSPITELQNYEERAVFTSSTNHTKNLNNLKQTKIRFYTEPDLNWWRNNRQADLDQLNAYYLKKLAASLKQKGFEQVSYIETTNKGYRKNGTRHPHSWSIVNKEELFEWMTK